MHFAVWTRGRERFQGGAGGVMAALEADPVSGRFKLDPLALHLLVARGYRSVGCAPCTRAVEEGEDVRAGRWWPIDKSECGIHRADGQPSGSGSPTRTAKGRAVPSAAPEQSCRRRPVSR